MLLNLHIKNMVLIDEIDINFSDNLNILTGETGAGKSIIIGSINIALGGKFSKELVRDESQYGLVELLFSIDNDNTIQMLKELEVIPSEDGELLISRKIQNGKIINKINEETVTVTKLKEVAATLINVHGQHDNQTLLVKKNHIKILDKYGHNQLLELKLEVRNYYKEYVSIYTEIQENQINEEERNRQIDFIHYEIEEIEKANLKEGEDDNLQSQYKLMINSKTIVEHASEINKLTGDYANGAAELIGQACKHMNNISELDTNLKNLESMLNDVDGILNDFNVELSDYMLKMSFEPSEFEEVEQRLNLINNLKAKYGKQISDILQYKADKQIVLEKYCAYDEFMNGLKNKLDKCKKNLMISSQNLSKARKLLSKKLTNDIKAALIDLNFLDVQFDMIFEEATTFSAEGIDEPYFVISTNIGETVKPLSEVASGGELSRIMLAIKSTLADVDEIDTLIFDEIDAGISGRTAQMVSEKLALIGKSHQIICITHLPQIGAMADTHFEIKKYVEKDKTITTISELDEEASIDEISRLISGVEITDVVKASAREMKKMALELKKQ